MLHQQLAEVETVYDNIEGPHIVQMIGKFLEDQHIDRLVADKTAQSQHLVEPVS